MTPLDERELLEGGFGSLEVLEEVDNIESFHMLDFRSQY